MSLKIYRTYDIKTVDNVRKNPYMLVDDVDGIGFATADRIAGELGIEKDSDRSEEHTSELQSQR